MPYVHTSRFQIRHYECDSFGRLRPATLLGYLQESAFDASAAVGYSAARYDEIGYQWFAYETQLSLLRSLHYGDSVEIRTWVHDFRRVRSLRQYEVYRNGELVAHAETDWVFIHQQTLYPSSIPPEIVEAYSRGEDVLPAEPRPPFPPFPPTPVQVNIMHRQVELRDLDPAKHVNNAVYLQIAQESEQQAVASQGWTLPRFEQAGVALVLKRARIEYKLAAVWGDVLNITTWAYEITQHGGLRAFEIKRSADGKLLARIQTAWGFEDIGTGETVPAPDAFLQDIQ
jgi:YbgC/YbaW family acyl-CoA thioester hydrolase